MSILNTQLVTSTVLSAGSVIPLGNIVHKCGNNITATGTTIKIKGSGFFKITAYATIEPTAVTDMEITISDNGTAIASATATPAVASDPVNLAIGSVIYNSCHCNEDAITFSVNSAGTVTEFDVIVEAL